MRLGRLMLVVATLVAILVFPLVARDALSAIRMPSAYAAADGSSAAGRVYQNGNNNDNNDNGDDSDDDDDDDNENNNNNESNDNDDEDNDNAECYLNLNDNDPVPCDFDDNDNDYYVPPPTDQGAPAPPAPGTGYIPPSRRCFDVQEVGNVQLTLSGGTITVQVVPGVGFPSVTWVELDDVDDMSGIPAFPAGTTLLDSMIWHINAGDGCDGAGIGTLPNDVNLGIPYSVPADKSKLQIIRLSGDQWVNVNTVPDPDPNNPYISSTIREAGIYAVVQKP